MSLVCVFWVMSVIWCVMVMWMSVCMLVVDVGCVMLSGMLLYCVMLVVYGL